MTTPDSRERLPGEDHCLDDGDLFKILHDHPFVPTGRRVWFLCGQAPPPWPNARPTCTERGFHEPCATCGWPSMEHPAPSPITREPVR